MYVIMYATLPVSHNCNAFGRSLFVINFVPGNGNDKPSFSPFRHLDCQEVDLVESGIILRYNLC